MVFVDVLELEGVNVKVGRNKTVKVGKGIGKTGNSNKQKQDRIHIYRVSRNEDASECSHVYSIKEKGKGTKSQHLSRV